METLGRDCKPPVFTREVHAMLLRNPLALENMNEFRIAKPVVAPAPAPVADEPTASELRTNRVQRATAGIDPAEQRQLLHRERIAQNTYHRNNAIDFEREHYCALSLV